MEVSRETVVHLREGDTCLKELRKETLASSSQIEYVGMLHCSGSESETRYKHEKNMRVSSKTKSHFGPVNWVPPQFC